MKITKWTGIPAPAFMAGYSSGPRIRIDICDSCHEEHVATRNCRRCNKRLCEFCRFGEFIECKDCHRLRVATACDPESFQSCPRCEAASDERARQAAIARENELVPCARCGVAEVRRAVLLVGGEPYCALCSEMFTRGGEE